MNIPSPLKRLPNHKLTLGLFLPMQEGAWSPSTASRSTSWTFDYITRCTRMAEEFGFDLAFGLAQWLGKGGYGGEMRFREHEVDPIIANAALSSLTTSIVLINTVHILYAWGYSDWRTTSLGSIIESLEQRLILELAGEVEGRAVLDVGCGDGALALAFQQKAAGRVIGCDIDPRRLLAPALSRQATGPRSTMCLPGPSACRFGTAVSISPAS